MIGTMAENATRMKTGRTKNHALLSLTLRCIILIPLFHVHLAHLHPVSIHQHKL